MGLVADRARRRRFFRALATLLCLCALSSPPNTSADPPAKVSFGPEPDWVLPATNKPPPALAMTNSGELFLFVDRQINFRPGGAYHRTVRKILTRAEV